MTAVLKMDSKKQERKQGDQLGGFCDNSGIDADGLGREVVVEMARRDGIWIYFEGRTNKF